MPGRKKVAKKDKNKQQQETKLETYLILREVIADYREALSEDRVIL